MNASQTTLGLGVKLDMPFKKEPGTFWHFPSENCRVSQSPVKSPSIQKVTVPFC